MALAYSRAFRVILASLIVANFLFLFNSKYSPFELLALRNDLQPSHPSASGHAAPTSMLIAPKPTLKPGSEVEENSGESGSNGDSAENSDNSAGQDENAGEQEPKPAEEEQNSDEEQEPDSAEELKYILNEFKNMFTDQLQSVRNDMIKLAEGSKPLTEEEREKRQKEEEEKRREEEERKRKEEEERKKLQEFYDHWKEILFENLAQEEQGLQQPLTFLGNDPVEPRGNKIAVLSAFDNGGASGRYQQLVEMAMANRDEFCDYHGYIHQFVNFTDLRTEDPDRLSSVPAVWLKMDAIKKTFDLHPSVEWIWWIDTDLIITNPLVDLARHILNPRVLAERACDQKPMLDVFGRPTGKVTPRRGERNMNDIEIIISQDWLGLNAGSMFIKRSAFMYILLDIWLDPLFVSNFRDRKEQDCLIHLIANHENVRRRTAVVPQRLINSYHEFEEKKDTCLWRKGDLVVHFAGRSERGDYLDLWDHYWNNRILLPEEFRIAPVNSTNPPRPKSEEEKKKEEEEKKKKEEEEKKRKEEEERKKQEEEKKKKEQEEKKQGENGQKSEEHGDKPREHGQKSEEQKKLEEQRRREEEQKKHEGQREYDEQNQNEEE